MTRTEKLREDLRYQLERCRQRWHGEGSVEVLQSRVNALEDALELVVVYLTAEASDAAVERAATETLGQGEG